MTEERKEEHEHEVRETDEGTSESHSNKVVEKDEGREHGITIEKETTMESSE